MRLQSKFHRQGKPKSIEEVAGALGFNAWKIAKKTVNKLYADGFNYSSEGQILDVVAEFIAFMIQTADRLAYQQMNDEQRQRFVSAMAGQLVNSLAENMTDVHGEADHKSAFIEKLNDRLESYAEYGFVDGQPSYQALRYFGKCVDEVMGGDENKWVLEQIIEVEAPAVLQSLKKNMDSLLTQSELVVKSEE